jgi:uncharacterized protein (DUF1330 family)
MTVYAVAQISIHDRDRYQGYVRAFMATLAPYGGRLLVAQESPEVVEGTWGHDKVIIIAFDDRDSFLRWSRSPEYQAISVDRVAATEGVVLLVEGIPTVSGH